MFVAELDDVRGGDRADAVDRVELLDGRGAEADRAVFGRRAGGARRRRPGPRSGTTTCCPSASRAARLTASSSASGCGAAGPLRRRR